MADIAGAGAAVDQPGAVLLLDVGTVVVRADEDVHVVQAVQQVESLGFEAQAVAIARAGVRQDHDQVRILLLADPVHPVLHAGNQRFKAHAFPDRLVQPGFHVGVRETEHRHAEAAPFKNLIAREIGVPRLDVDGVGAHEGDAVGL